MPTYFKADFHPKHDFEVYVNTPKNFMHKAAARQSVLPINRKQTEDIHSKTKIRKDEVNDESKDDFRK